MMRASNSNSTNHNNNNTIFTMPDSTTESSSSTSSSFTTIIRTFDSNTSLHLDNNNHKKNGSNTPTKMKSIKINKAAKRRQRSMKEVDEDLRYNYNDGEDPQLMKLVVEDNDENEDYGIGHSRENSSSRCSSGTQSPDSEEKRRGRPRSDVVVSLMLQGSASPSSIKCQFCGRVFPREKSLQAHLRTHTGEKPYGCDFPDCGRAFTQSGQLKTHQRLHAGEKPFVCSNPGCTVRFTHANRHCPLHPGAMLKRCYDFVIKPVINNDSAQSILIQQWLEKYKIERELASKSTSPPSATSTSLIKINSIKANNANTTTTIINKPTISSCKRGNNGQVEQEQENVVNQNQMSSSSSSNGENGKEYSSPINNHSINANKSKRQILSQSPGYGQHLSPSKSININYFHHNNNMTSPSKNQQTTPTSSHRRTFGSPVKCLNLNWSSGSPGGPSLTSLSRTPASASRPEKLKRRWLESLNTPSSPSKDYNKAVPTCLFREDQNNGQNYGRPSVLVMAPVNFLGGGSDGENQRIKQEIRSHHFADSGSAADLNNSTPNYYFYNHQNQNHSSELYITEHHGEQATTTDTTTATTTNRLYISAENENYNHHYLNNDPLNLSPQK